MNKLKEYFGEVSEEQIKSTIKRIIASYRNIWDILVELIQNSADAIIQEHSFEKMSDGNIKINIDTLTRRIVISDNGCGITPDNLSRILVTGASLKRENINGKYGFMGFGLTFIAFQTEYIKISSVHKNVKSSVTYRDLYKVVFNDADIPNSEEEKEGYKPEECKDKNGTEIELVFPEKIDDKSLDSNLKLLFKFCKNEMLIEYILRTRSALGLLDTVFEEKQNFKFSFSVDGEEYKILNSYFTNKEIVNRLYPDDSRVHDLDGDYKTVIQVSENMPEYQKKATRSCLLLYKAINNIDIGTRDKMRARIYIEGTSKENLNEYEKKIGICGKDADEYAGFQIQNGIWLSINGLPTGIQIDKLDHGTYLPYTCIVDILDSELREELDTGRKGITDYKVRLIKDKVKEELAEHLFILYRPYLMKIDTRSTNPFFEARSEYEKILNNKSFNNKLKINRYLPPNEEKEVLSIFIELLSSSILKGYYCKALSGYQVYDGYFGYNAENSDEDILYSELNLLGISNCIFNKYGNSLNKDVIIEFKRDFKDIYKDINRNTKDFSQIDLLVCWDSNFDIKNSIRKSTGDELIEVSPKERYFYGSTHELITPRRQTPLPIIELKKIIDIIL